MEDFQLREEHWVIADLMGKAKHVRTVPVPTWAKPAVDEWITAAGINTGPIFRRVSRLGKVGGDGITPKAIWHVVKAAAKRAGIKGGPVLCDLRMLQFASRRTWWSSNRAAHYQPNNSRCSRRISGSER